MKRVNAEYATRVVSILDNTILALRNEAKCNNQDNLPTKIANQIEILKDHMHEVLSLTLEEDESLRADIRKFDCEASAKAEELLKYQARLFNARDLQNERRQELEGELQMLKRELEERKTALENKQDLELKQENREMDLQRARFDEEMNILHEKNKELQVKLEDQRKYHAAEESKIRNVNDALANQIKKLLLEHKVAMEAKVAEVDSTKLKLDQIKQQRIDLEEYFVKIDKNNAARKTEEESLQRVAGIKTKAMELLHQGAIQFQKRWRGVRDRAAVEKLKEIIKKKKSSKGKKTRKQ